MENGKLETWEAVHQYVFAGNAIFTLKSVPTGQRFTYKITRLKEPNKRVWFVSVLRGPDNEEDYAYIGVLNDTVFRLSPKSKISSSTQSFKVFAWFMSQLGASEYDGPVREDLEVWHTGRCGRCGRKLTVPESVASGMGPECRKAT